MSITIAVQPASLTAQLCRALEPHRNGSFKTIKILANREGAELSLAGSNRSWPPWREGLILLPPALLVLCHVPLPTSPESRRGSWQPSQAFTSLGGSGRHPSPLGLSQTALFTPKCPHLGCCSLPFLPPALGGVLPPDGIALKLGQSSASGFAAHWIIPLPKHLPLSSELFTPECLAYSQFKHLKQFTYYLRATVKPTHLILATSPKGVRIQCLMPQTLTERRKTLLFEKYTLLNYRGTFHSGFLKWLSFLCLLQCSLNQESLSTHSRSSSSVSFSSKFSGIYPSAWKFSAPNHQARLIWTGFYCLLPPDRQQRSPFTFSTVVSQST